MTYSPSVGVAGPPPVISFFGRCGNSRNSSAMTTIWKWPLAKHIVYAPIFVDQTVTITQIGWLNGATVTGNGDAGIYSDVAGAPLTKLVSTGATALSGGTAVQAVDIADYVLPGPACYWLAFTASSGDAYITSWQESVVTNIGLGLMAETTADFGLPATATPVAPTYQNCPVVALLISPRTVW